MKERFVPPVISFSIDYIDYLTLTKKILIQKGGCVYIMTNFTGTVLYIGVTSDLRTRILQHKTKFYPNSFTAKYHCNKLVWFEHYETITAAITKEKLLKGGNGKAKENLINKINPEWKDLWEDVELW